MINAFLVLSTIVLSSLVIPAAPQTLNKVERLELVRSGTGVFVSNLSNDTVVYLNGTTSARFTVVAKTTTGLGPVKFGWNENANYQTERNPPFLLCGGTFTTCTKLVAGTHKVTAVVTTSTAVPYQVSFQIVNGFAPTAAPKAPPTKAPRAPTFAPKVPTNAPRVPTKAPFAPSKAPKAPTLAPKVPTKAPKAPTFAPKVPTVAPKAVSPVAAPMAKAPVVAPMAPALKAPLAPVAAPAVPRAPVLAPAAAKAPTAPKSPVVVAPAVVTPSVPKAPTVVISPTSPKAPMGAPSSPKAPLGGAPTSPKAPFVAPLAPKAPILVPTSPKAPFVAPLAPKAPLGAPLAPKAPAIAPSAPKAPLGAPLTPKAPLVAPKTPVAVAPTTAIAPKAPVVAPKAPVIAPTTAAPKVAPTLAPRTLQPVPAPVPYFAPILINCGGNTYTDSQNRVWSGDKQVAIGGNIYSTTSDILGTVDDAIFQVNRLGTVDDAIFQVNRWGQHRYEIPVPRGRYEIVIHLAEIHFTKVNERVFDMSIEGQWINDIDMVQLSGGVSFTATSKRAVVDIEDGFVSVELFDNNPIIDFPSIGGIEVNRIAPSTSAPVPTAVATKAPVAVPLAKAPIAAPLVPVNAPLVAPLAAPMKAPISPPVVAFQPILINCGGATYTDSQNRVWSDDNQFAIGGNIYSTTSDILGTADDAIFQVNRWGQHRYEIQVPSGRYEVIIHLGEIYFTKQNERVFDLAIEGTRIEDIDMVQLSGGVSFTATSKRAVVDVSDNFVSIELFDNNPIIDFPSIAGIEVNRIAPPTAAPVPTVVATMAPVAAPLTKAPIVAPLVPVKAPVVAPLAAPLKAPLAAPFAPVKAPVLAPLMAPIAAPAVAPVTVPVQAPVSPPFAPIAVPTFQPILINCGDEAYTDTQGRVWVEDKFYSGGALYATHLPIYNSSTPLAPPIIDYEVFHTIRWGPHQYDIPVPSGHSYEIVLHMAEIYFTTIGARVFDIDVEGQFFADVDIVQLSGGMSYAATSIKTIAFITDGSISIQFFDNVPLLDHPSISAIEVNQIRPAVAPMSPNPALATTAPIRIPIATNAPFQAPVAPPAVAFHPILINCGGGVYTDSQNRVWSDDKKVAIGGNTFGTSAEILGTVDDAIFQVNRWGQHRYEIPVPRGRYEIVIHLAEIHFTKVNERIFDMSIEGQWINDIDMVQLSGGVSFTATSKRAVVDIEDGFVSVELFDNNPIIDFPSIGGIEVNRITPSTAAPVPTVVVTKAPATAILNTTKAPQATPTTTAAPTNAPVKVPVPTTAPMIEPVRVPTAAPIKPTVPTFEPILINCGGDAYADRQHRLWLADVYAEGGQLFNTGNNILGTENDELYQSHRWGQLSYKIAVPIGQYEVVLHSAEIYFQEPGKRVFDVNVEGQLIEDIDLVKLANGTAFTAVTISTTVYVVDGFVSIKLLDNVPLIDFPTLGAIEINRVGEVPPAMAPAPVAPAPFQTILICSGGVEYTDTQGRVWMADKFFDGGNVYFNGAKAISGTADDPIYQGERWGSFTYEIPIPEGDYVVILHFAEIYFEKRGERIFDVTVEGKQMNDIDLVQYGGGIPNKALTREMPVSVVDGYLSLAFIKNDPQVSEPKLSGIEVKLIGVHYSHAVTGGPYIAVDTDANGFEMVRVDASESHTHGPGQVLRTFTWKQGKAILGTGEMTTLKMPVGKHDITLTVVDSSGDVNIDVTTITVKPDGYPDIDSLSPASGDVAGGIPVTIKGNAFSSVTEVKFGLTTLSGSDITIVDAKTIIVTAPLSTIGVPVAVTVMTPFGASNSISYLYIDANPIAFNINKVVEFANPTAVAFGPDGKLYVANTKGQLGRFTLNDNYNAVVSSVIATIGDGTRGIHSIAFDPMETAELGNNINVYIASSRIFHKEPRNSFGLGINGKIQTVKGANLDIVTNIITGLPVSELDHSVNGIYFGDNGELYIGIGSNTNGGLPGALSASQTMTENFFSAAILVANMGVPGFDGFIQYNAPNNGSPVAGFGSAGVEVFAAGTRNPYGIWKHSNGNVYATDNGPNPGFGPMSTGCGVGEQIPDAYEFDELNIIKRGGYYGHPNFKRAETDPRQCVWRPASSFGEEGDGYTAPMMKLSSSTDGIIEFESDHFNGQLRGDLILSKYKDGLYRVILSEDGQTVNPISVPAIAMAGDDGLAVTQAPDGSMIDARYEANSCFTFQPDEPATTTMDIKSVFPRRGGLAGGSKLMIFGANFGGAAPPMVTVGGNECTGAILVSAKKIECTLPAGSVGRADVVVTIGATSDTFVKGYRYITGRPM